MGLFGIIKAPSVAQVGELIRLNASQSFAAKGQAAIVQIEIEPEAAAGFVDVTNAIVADQFLDWVYSTPGAKTATVRVTDADTNQATSTVDLTIVTAAEDALFSSDEELTVIESDAMRYLPEGRSSWNFLHREIKKQILEDLSDLRLLNADGADYVAADLVDRNEVRRWANHWAAQLMFEDLSNSESDTFADRARQYASKVAKYRAGALNTLRIDIDGDGEIGATEIQDGAAVKLTRKW